MACAWMGVGAYKPMSVTAFCSAGERLKSEKFKRFFVGWYVKAGRVGQLNLLSTCEVKLLLFNISVCAL
jgi:hypothetical protein